MAQRKNANRKENLQNFKQNKKREMESKNQQHYHENGLPKVRQQPVWNSNQMLDITGQEFEAIVQGMESAANGYLAVQNAINRNLIEGKIRMEYLELNEAGTGYQKMSEEASKPYQEELKKMIKTAQDFAEQAKEQVEKTNTLAAV
jgi:hypothetical protein